MAVLAFKQQYALSADIKNSFVFRIYIFLAYGTAYFFLFVMSPSRMQYFKKCDIYILACSLFSSIIILFSGNIDLSTGDVLAEGVSRATIKEPLMLLFIISAYWLFFCSFKKKLIGAGCILIAFYGIYMSMSQSALISILLISFGILILSWFSHNTKNIMFILAAMPVALFAGASYMYSSKGFERLSHIVDWEVYYNAGSGYDTSRIELLNWGWEIFKSSPIVGLNPYLPNGSYTHFFVMDILMCMGVLGIVCLFAFFSSIIKGAINANRLCGTSAYWMILLCIYSLSQSIFHGSVTSIMSAGTSIMIGFSLYYNNRQI
ncbi:MAG: hypothetical protein IJI37_03930 [Opitutales bacterium]|nr:hypothetical protein [Opitutales bacterium]